MPLRLSLVLVVVGCGGGGGFPDARSLDDTPVPGGRFTLDWSVTDMNGAPLACDRIGGVSVTTTLHDVSAQGSEIEAFGCTGPSATSMPFHPGTWDFSYELQGVVGQLATAPGQRNVVLTSGETTRLMPISFSVDATGGLALHFNTNKAGGNCAATGANGAGITGSTITLVHQATTTCEPVMLNIGAGATQPASQYTINCGAPAVAPCIEADQAITVSGVPSDIYNIHIRGKIGATDCWINDDTLKVPPIGKVLTQTLNLAKVGGAGC